MRKVEEYLHLHEVDHWELMNLFLHHFSHAQNPVPFFYKYQANGSPDNLEVTASENGQIIKVQFSDGFPEAQLLQIEQKIKDTLLTTESSIGADILFCPERVTGYFRYKELFQIFPVPEGSPMPNVGFRDYPFLIQFTYKKSSNMTVDYSRRREKAAIYTRLLNLLCNQKIRLIRNNAQSYWTFDVDETTGKMTSSYRQEGYTFEGLSLIESNFTDTSKTEVMGRAPFQKYYTSPGTSSDPLKLPDNIERSLDRIFSLSEQDHERFFRACTWYEKGQDIWQDSASSSFVALVSAIETLIGEQTKCESCNQDVPEGLLVCDTCKQPRYQVTKHFKEFLVKHVSDLNTMPKEAAILYSTRSNLAHGVKLLQQDLKPWSFTMNPIKDDEGRMQRNLFYITSIAIYNWLWGRTLNKK
ncbi:MAG: hypothetical protein HY426_04145 [Candidatus Levybacteria bacterium]|nr:hypothetical protein [Candidatus Levybacteria bacterium]